MGKSAERQQAEAYAKPAPPQILSPKQGAEAMVESGVSRHAQRIDVLFLKAIWGGIFLSYGNMLESVIGGVSQRVTTEWAGVIRLLEGLVFPVGLAMIVFSGTELLTSDMMFFFLAAAKGKIPWWSVPYGYLVVFFGNLVGSLFFVGILAKYGVLVGSESIHTFISGAATTRVVELTWGNLLCRGIGCNIMVCMAVYLAAQASDLTGKAVGIWIALSTFVVLQQEHVVADMFTIPMAIVLRTPGVTVAKYIYKTMLAALVGNLIGALLLSASLYWFYLHDHTHTAATHVHDDEATVNGEANGHSKPGPLGEGTFGHPFKVQHIFRPEKHQIHEKFAGSGYDRDHF